MNRRSFMKLGAILAPVVAVPTVAYSFLGRNIDTISGYESGQVLVWELNVGGKWIAVKPCQYEEVVIGDGCLILPARVRTQSYFAGRAKSVGYV